MKKTEYNFDEERAILTGMLVDDIVLGRISAQYKKKLFKNAYSNTIADWCVEYYQKYEKAPGKKIQNIFEIRSVDIRDKSRITLIGNFLESLSNEYKKLKRESNSDFTIDSATKYFNRVSLENLSENIQACVDNGKPEKAIERIKNFGAIELGVGKCIEVFRDWDAIKSAFQYNHEPLIKYHHGLGKFFGDRLERDGFIVFMGPEKRGKTFWLLDSAFRAVLQRRKVAFFEVGDLSEHQIMRRFMVRVSKNPEKSGDVEYPIMIVKKGKKGAKARTTIKHYPKKLDEYMAMKACKKIKNNLRLSVHYNDTLSVDGISNILKSWYHDSGWIPDIIVIDYADILNMDMYGADERERTNKTWQQLRRMSQEYHCLVLTATQSNSAAYSTKTIGQENFSTDKRKHAHVTGMVGLNQTPEEKEQGLMRLNWIELREGNYSPRQCCHVATCFPLANMAVKSIF